MKNSIFLLWSIFLVGCLEKEESPKRSFAKTFEEDTKRLIENLENEKEKPDALSQNQVEDKIQNSDDKKFSLTPVADKASELKESNYIVKSALNMELIWCPQGRFIMGPGNEGYAGVSPSFEAVLSHGFYLGKTEVTQKEYEEVMGGNPSSFKGEGLPVDSVSWYDAVEFCNTLNEIESKPVGWEFSLPTEAQWEYACRAETATRHYWGDKSSPELSNNISDETVAVGSYRPNPWGFYDMEGNVWEWCSDWFQKYPTGTIIDPRGPIRSSNEILGHAEKGKVVRGGAYSSAQLGSRHRDYPRPTSKNPWKGFRLCLKRVK